MFVHTQPHDDNMLLNFLSYTIAIVGACWAATTPVSISLPHFSFIELINNPEFYVFLLKAIISTSITLTANQIVNRVKAKKTTSKNNPE